MSCNPQYLFGHAVMAGMLATNDQRIDTFKKYQKQCEELKICHYGEIFYMEFWAETGRNLKES